MKNIRMICWLLKKYNRVNPLILRIVVQAFFRNWVKTAFAPRITTQDAPKCHGDAADDAEAGNGGIAVFRASWMIFASWVRHEARERAMIER